MTYDKIFMLPKADMKLPKGYGTVKKQSGNRRYPYLVQVPDGRIISKDGKSRIKYKTLGTVLTREEGIILLNRYHHVNDKTMFLLPTFEDVYFLWFEDYFGKDFRPIITDYKAVFNTRPVLHEKHLYLLRLVIYSLLLINVGRIIQY